MNANHIIKQAEKVATKMTGETSGAFYQAALAGALQARVTELCGKLAVFEAETGTRTTTYPTEMGELVVNYDITAPDDEVGYQGGLTIEGIFANGMDITDCLYGTKLFDLIEEHCWEAAEQDMKDAEYDRADHYYQSRKDDEMMGAA
jgi:hypothetical protein